MAASDDATRCSSTDATEALEVFVALHRGTTARTSFAVPLDYYMYNKLSRGATWGFLGKNELRVAAVVCNGDSMINLLA